MKHFKTFLAAMLLLLVGSNYVGAVEPSWPDSAVVPVAGQNYYIYNKTRGRFICFQGTSVTSFDPTRTSINLGPTTGSTATEKGNQAVLFKLENGSTGCYKLKVVEQFGGKTWYMSSSISSISTSSYSSIVIPSAGTDAKGKTYYYIYKKNNSNRLYMGTSATTSASLTYGASSNSGKEWYFIPEKCIKGCSVSSKQADGTISITAPTDKGKASVTFNVSGPGTVSNFTWTSSNSKIIIGFPTRSSNVVTVPVHYTAENKHGLPIETATITLTSKDNATSKTGTVNANVNLQPTFSTVVYALDWNRVNEEIVERFYVGMAVAASERDRLANKLLVSNANTMAKRTITTKTVWTATIIGDNANQFKFPNGTQSYSGNYVTDNFLSAFDVHYAPTVAGEHTATLRIVASYTAANGAQTDTHDIALSGRCEAGSIITFAADDSPSDDEIYSFGNIIGTNKVDVTANLLISQVTDLQKVWSDPDGVFEFDPSSVNLSKVSQTLTFSAHRETPVTANTNHEATLTISGTSTVNGEPVSATFTLRYTAVPLETPTVTWNWDSIREGLTAYYPITTNSDGNWTLTKTAGDKLTYDPASNKNEATAEYLHHEPGQSAAFYLQIPQTDTYAAFEGEYETAIDVSPVPTIHLTTYTQYTDPSVMTYKVSEFMGEQIPSASFEETQHRLTIDGGGWVDFFTAGHNVISFSYDDDPKNYNTPTWTVTEYYGNNTSAVLYEEVVLTSGTDVTWQFSPNATKIRIEETGGWSNGFFTNVRISEYDVIAADAEIVALIDDNGTVSDRDITLTFANKRQVTATLNETAAQYFTIVDATPAAAVPEINLTTAAQFDDESIMTYMDKGSYFAGAEFDESAHTLTIKYNHKWVEFVNLSGQSKISFRYDDDPSEDESATWTVTEYIGDAENVIYNNVTYTSGEDVTWSFSSEATKIRIENSSWYTGCLTNVRLYGEAPSSSGSNEPGSSVVYDSDKGLGVGKVVEGKVITVALKGGVNLADAKEATAGNACQLILEDDYTYDHEVLVLPIAIVSPCDITYKHSANGTYVVTYQGEDSETVSSADLNKYITETNPDLYVVTLSAPTPASGYRFQGWKINDVIVSCKETFTTSVTVSGSIVEAAFVAVEAQNFKVGEVYFADMGAALTAAGTSSDSKIVTQMQDVTLGDGTTPIEYIVPAGVTLLVPHKADFFEVQETPEVVGTAEVLSAYRTLTLKEGVTITCNGNICISGKLMSSGGGNKSAYTTGECGVINMANGGHIELNNGAHLYCWGYIKGQDMDQGNNTVGTGTVTANSGATVWENFELGDWRGGTASFNIYYNNETEHRKLFPFQSYALQNVEIPTSFMHGSTLRTFTSITTSLGHHDAIFSMVGPENTMFLLTDEQSVVRMWYDPTTDLSCYELSGTAKLDALHVTVYVDMSSENFILPISNSMHIILKDCNMNLANPLMVQAGAIVEIKPSATVNLTSELYLYDVDQWGKYIHNYYFRSFNNLSSHKDRGAENSKAGLDDAKLIVDGIFNVQNGGKLYATAGGANIMGNDGGQISFKSALPADNILWAVTVLSGAPYINWEYNDVKAANLCNEDGSYTKSEGFNKTYYNIHGRWFKEDDKNEQPDHTYWFRYLSEGNAGEEEGTAAVYSHDKTGLEARMKWFNVTMDENCLNYNPDPDNIDDTSDWWVGTNPTAYYNYTMLNDWHQFIATETENVYSGSNNMLYQKNECQWVETGAVDENCLYTFVDGEENITKKALVDGHFIPLTSNGYDPAYHQTDDASKYFICFAGCNWHPATRYTGESKAYTIHPEDEDLHYIWFNNDWMNVLRDEPFFYTEDEQTNVRTYYEYINGEWEIATPYVSVSDAAETRTFYMIKEAFNVASIKKNATITLLRDLPNVSERLSYETQNTTCTLDLNGHLLAGEIDSLIYVNAPGATFIITDNTTLKLGKIHTTKTRAIFVKAGTVEVNNGTIEATPATRAAYAIYGAAAATININGGYFLAQGNSSSKCVHAAGTYAITGGYYNINTGLANYTVDAYPFANDDPVYKWVVEAAWTIIFKNGETTLQTLHLHPGEMPVYTAAFPTLDNHQFTGWNPAVAAATANVTYQAQFAELEGEEKCVTFNANGGNATLPYKYVTSGDPVGDLPTATKAGHTFTGWFTEASAGTEVTSFTTVSADVTYYAHYTKNSYTLTWNANGATITSADDAYTHGSVEYGTAIIVPSVSKEGWTFDGWNVTPASTMPAANTTYTAQWTIPYTVQHKQQNLNDAGYTEFETDNFTAKSGEYVTPAVKTYDGFITPETQTVQIGETSEVTYNYVRRTYTITLDATTNEGTCETASLEVKHGAAPVLPDATKEGRVFEGWFTKAVGGDQITNETLILRNMGTLYAQFSEASLNVTTPITISDTREVTDLRITTTGSLTITGSVTANNFILESNGATASGQFVAGYNKLTYEHAYFDLKLNAKNHQWYAVAVPWPVNATSGVSVNGKTLELGKDFDIIYYDGTRRAAEGKQKCWSYVEDDGDKTLVPGRLYMIGLMGDAATVRFEKKDGVALLTTTTSVAQHTQTTGDDYDAGWNGVANPALFHAFVNPGVTEGQVYNPDTKSYSLITLNANKFVVGEGAFVQVSTGKAITVTKDGAFAAPRRTRAQANLIYDVRIAPANGAYTDRLFIKTTDSKENVYTVGQDLAKVGVSSIVPQMWINRYDAKLCVNTAELISETAEYPLGISVPANGEYTISLAAQPNEDYTVYLTLNGEAVWNLGNGEYTLTLSKGTSNEYGLRISAKSPAVATDIDEAVVDAQGDTKKVLINDKVFIIRGENVYSIDGQLVK